MYQKAWANLLLRIEEKTSWGRNDLKQLMLECLILTKDIDVQRTEIKLDLGDKKHED